MKFTNFHLQALLMVLIVSPLFSGTMDTPGTISFAPVPKKSLHNVRIITNGIGKKLYVLNDLSYQKTSDPFITDIVLSFNAPPSRMHRDDTKHYRVIQSDYNFISGRGALGKGCGEFFKKEHGVTIETTKGAWLGACDDIGSFTIEFRLFPYELRDGGQIFSRIGFLSGRKQGIEIEIRNQNIISVLYGIFRKPDGQPVDVVMKRGRDLQKQKWYHFSLSFDRLSGSLTKYVNGEEAEVQYITESGEPFNGVYTPSFGKPNQDGTFDCVDLPPVYIGKNYSGLLDEFRISYRHYTDLARSTEIAYKKYHSVGRIGKIPFNVEGIITSPVYSFPGTGTMVTDFRWKELLREDTFIWMQFRISDLNFAGDSTDIKWYRIDNNQKNIYLKKENGEYLRGKYYQWRAHLISSPEGKRSPSLSDIELDFRLDRPPTPPQFVEVASTGDREVVLRWKKNTDNDILGYKIYYGTIPRTYDGIITVIGGNRITNGANAGNIIEVKITNDVLNENRSRDKWGKLTYPLLKNTVLYYFAVSAYDSYKPDTPYNHESDLSKKVAARPYEGSEIR